VKAEILTIGDELLRGEIVDSNKALLSDRLFSLDVETRFQVSVRDDPVDMEDALRRAAGRSDIALISGGLGPTRDDLTIEVLARTFGRELQVDQASLEGIKAFFARFGREMAPNNAKQANFPQGAEVLPNPIGTAPGCLLEESGTLFFCMPGVPRELERMMDEQVLPRIAKRLAGAEGRPVVRAALLRTFGMGESNLDEELADIARGDDVSLGFRTAFPDNYLRPVARGATASEAETKLARVCDAIRERLGPLVYGSDAETMEEVVGKLMREQRPSPWPSPARGVFSASASPRCPAPPITSSAAWSPTRTGQRPRSWAFRDRSCGSMVRSPSPWRWPWRREPASGSAQIWPSPPPAFRGPAVAATRSRWDWCGWAFPTAVRVPPRCSSFPWIAPVTAWRRLRSPSIGSGAPCSARSGWRSATSGGPDEG
jgi:nicotinamide-nucleotide amidase